MRSRSGAFAGPIEEVSGEHSGPHAPERDSAGVDALRGRAILVADAHADTRELYAVYLKSAGATVVDAPDGRDALVKTFDAQPDAIVADSQLPFIDGAELCRLLRGDAATARLPIVLVTANAQTPAVHELWRAGADAAFTKPFSPQSLVAELARLLRSGRAVEMAGVAASGGADGDGDGAAPRDRRRRGIRQPQPFLAPPTLRCPTCDGRLQYERSHTGGIGARGAEQWDYFTCARCGTFQYRHRTRKLRRMD
jgi:CheY-like chemotaxis protein